MTASKANPASPPTALTLSAYRQYGPALHRYLLRRIHRPDEAPDLAQEVFERFLKKKDRPEVVRNPLAYLFGIASNVVSETLYKESHSCVGFDSKLLAQVAEAFDSAAPEELAERLGLQRDLLDALGRLPANYRTTFLLVEGEQLSYEEAARESGFTVQTIGTYLSRARAQLKTSLADYWRRKESKR